MVHRRCSVLQVRSGDIDGIIHRHSLLLRGVWVLVLFVLFVFTKSGCCFVCCFSHSAHWLPTRKKLLYTVANPARGLLNREKKKKKKSGSATPPPPPPRALLVRRKNKNNKIKN